MSLFRSLTIQSGVTTQIQDANSLIVGAGVTTASGNISISSTGGTTNLLDAVSIAANKSITAVTGTGAFDFSLATVAFKTSSGTNTIAGNVVSNGNITFDFSGSSGTFKTSVGTNTMGGNVSVASGKSLSSAGGAANFDWSASSGTFATSTGLTTISGNASMAGYADWTGIATPGSNPATNAARLYYKLTNAGFFYLDHAGTEHQLATGTGPIGLNGAYDSASSAADNIVGLTTANGPVLIRDNATPIGGNLFAVQDDPGTTTYFAVTATGITASNFSGTSSGTNTGDQTITLTGDVTGSGTGSFATVVTALSSATTHVNVNSATAPTSGQVLTATSGTAATWQTPTAAPVGANPSQTIDLSTHNGSATTFMRSDAAPALSQAITPTWTGTHTFSNVINANGGVDRSTAATLSIGTTNANAITISKSGVTTTVAGSLVVSQNLTVNGTTTTINSAVVDIADRLIHLNFAAPLSSAPVPAAIAGIDIDRGDNGVTQRDSAALLWCEAGVDGAGSHWLFALNTAADESTIGAKLAVHTGDLDVDGGMNQANGAVTLFGSVASSFTTASLDLTLGGADNLFLQSGAVTALTISAVGTAITVQSGATLSAASGGAVNATGLDSATTTVVVNAATAPTSGQVLTATSGTAATWQTPSSSSATADNVVATGLTTSALSTGLSGYISANDTLSKTDAAAMSTALFYGTYTGTSGSITEDGEVTVAMTTAGGSPSPGATVYVALASDDGATAAGKMTATAPSATGQVVMAVGYVRSNAGYAGSKTCVIKLAPGIPVQL